MSVPRDRSRALALTYARTTRTLYSRIITRARLAHAAQDARATARRRRRQGPCDLTWPILNIFSSNFFL